MMHRMFAATAGLVASALLLGSASQPVGGGAPATPDAPRLADAVFLAGAWAGAFGDDRVEEHWSRPDGTSILGMFRWLRADGSPLVFEILTITQEQQDVLLRLRHFDARLQPWPSETVPITLRLAEAGENSAVFRAVESEKNLAAVKYARPTPDELTIAVEFQGEPPREPLHFHLTRTAPAAK